MNHINGQPKQWNAEFLHPVDVKGYPPLFSIVTPVLNQASFIGATIDSVIGQCAEVRVEQIVMDACSTDGTAEVVDCYSGSTEPGHRLRYYREKDSGQSQGINNGFRRATGEIFAWLNADDIYSPGALEQVATVLPVDKPAWCFGRSGIIDEDGQPIRSLVSSYKDRHCRRYSYDHLLRLNFISQPSVFFNRKMWQLAGELDETLHLAMDYDYWLRCAKLAQPIFVDQVLSSFRWHRTSKSATNYTKAAHEAFGIATRHAAGKHSHSLAAHRRHVWRLSTAYTVMNWLGV